MDVNIFKMVQSIPVCVQPLWHQITDHDVWDWGASFMVNSLKHSDYYMDDMLECISHSVFVGFIGFSE
jgi:hypothetical protein